MLSKKYVNTLSSHREFGMKMKNEGHCEFVELKIRENFPGKQFLSQTP
jgi:hypothetical protein